MIKTFTDDDGNKVVPFGSAAVTVENGFWTFNGKEVRKGNFALQSFVSRFIVGCRLAYPVEERVITPSHSEIATRKTFICHGHLKKHNHRFRKVEERNLPEPIDILPEFVKPEQMVPGDFTTFTGSPDVEFIKKEN